MLDAVGVAPMLAPDEVGREITFDALRAEAANRHFWQGKPQQWRELLPADVALEIARPYANLLRRFQYSVQPDPDLTYARAAANWQEKLAARSDRALRTAAGIA